MLITGPGPGALVNELKEKFFALKTALYSLLRS
jgi:hypothetical protein